MGDQPETIMTAIDLRRGATIFALSVLTLGWMGCNTEAPTGVPTLDLVTQGKPTGGGGKGGKAPPTVRGPAIGPPRSSRPLPTHLARTGSGPSPRRGLH